jgi:hypothetical protein
LRAVPRTSREGSGHRDAVVTSACIAVYVLVAILAYGPAWLHGISHTLNCGGCEDNGQEVWFLAWAAHSLTHFVNPLRTNWIQFPYGVDLADNTSMPLAGFIGAPITYFLGPIATYNALLVAAFAGSATAMMFVSRRWVRSEAAAFVAGLLYGFSPYMAGQGQNHLFLLIAFVPPLVLLLLDEILIGGARPWWVPGIWLGVLGLVELGLSLELFADMALVAVIGIAIVFVVRGDVRARLAEIAKSLALAIFICAPLAAAYLVIGRTGAGSNVAHPTAALSGLGSDLSSLIAPTTNQLVTLGTSSFGSKLVYLVGATGGPDTAENGAYIGIPLLLLLLLGLWKYRREGWMRFVAAMAAVSFLLSMGSRFKVWGHTTPIPLPFAILVHLPLVKTEVAARYTLMMWVFVSLAIALILDRWLLAPSSVRRYGATSARALRLLPSPGKLLPTGLSLVGIVALVPSFQYQIESAQTPAWFTSQAVDDLPQGSVLLTYPDATGRSNLPELWQAVNGDRYRIPDGEIIAPGHLGPIEAVFRACWLDPNGSHISENVSGARRELVTLQVRTIVVPVQYSVNPGCALSFLRQVLGRPPAYQAGAAVWSLSPT